MAMFCAQGVKADEDSGGAKADAWQTPDWISRLDVTGRYVGTPGGSESQFMENHNLQSGPIVRFEMKDDVQEDGRLLIEGMFEPLQDRGFLFVDVDLPELLRFDSELQAWREYYNARTGEADQTVNGTRLGAFFPNGNNSTHFFGGGKPRVDWLRSRSGVSVDLPGPFHDLRADLFYRRTRGEMSLLKGGTVLPPLSLRTDPLDVDPTVAGSGPGTVFFDISSRKKIDYETIGGQLAARAKLGATNLQVDLRAMHHDLKSTVLEANFQLDATSSELARFGRDTTIDQGSVDLVASRNLAHNLFVFGGGSFSWERSEPEPSQEIQSGILSLSPVRAVTRETLNAEVTRFTLAFTSGTVFQPVPSVVVRATASARGSRQEGDLAERRDEISGLISPGDFGTIFNSSERDTASLGARVKADWRVASRLKIAGFAEMDYRYEASESRRTLNFVVAEAAEVEEVENHRARFKVGSEARYRFRRGRSLAAGYEFSYVGFEADVDLLSNQFIVADYERLRHRVHLKAAGRIAKKMHGELRAQYVFESRRFDAPNVDPTDFAASTDAEIEIQSFVITPMLTYQHNKHWSGVLSASLAREDTKLVDDGPAPAGFSSRFKGFAYRTLTGTVTASMNWVPTARVTNVLGYTLYTNADSVENVGHDASVRTKIALDENWAVTGTLRYLGFSPASEPNNVVDDYHAIVVSAGVTGRF
jgi:hypothetical protein